MSMINKPNLNTLSAARLQPALVWDPPVRLFHWAIVVLLAASWITGEEGGNAMVYHQWSGYGILTLVLFRLLWGVFGGPYARFRQFLRGPKAVLSYADSVLKGRPESYVGHTPLGGWVIVLLLALLLTQAGTGLFANDDIFVEGPLYGWVSKATSDYLTWMHKTNFNILLAVVGLHIAAVLFYLLVKKENLIAPMLSGRKQLPIKDSPGKFTSSWLALAILGLVALGVYWLVS